MEKEWQQFICTGKVADYLKYAQAYHEKSVEENQGRKERQDCDGNKSDTYRDCTISSTHGRLR